MIKCQICRRIAMMGFCGVNLCVVHGRTAIVERRTSQQLTYSDLEQFHRTGVRDADGDMRHAADPIKYLRGFGKRQTV